MSFGKRTRHGICVLENTILSCHVFFSFALNNFVLCIFFFFFFFLFFFKIEATFEIYEFVLLARPDTIFSAKAASILVSDMVSMHMLALKTDTYNDRISMCSSCFTFIF